jgi:hypothetical protein
MSVVNLPPVEMYAIPGGSPRKAAFKAQADEQLEQNNLVKNLQNGSGSLNNTRRRYDYRERKFPRRKMIGGEKIIPIPTFTSSSSTGKFPSPQNPNSVAKSALINLATAQKQGADDQVALEPSKAVISPYAKVVGGTRKRKLTRKKNKSKQKKGTKQKRVKRCPITNKYPCKCKPRKHKKNKSRKIKGGNKTKWGCLSGGRFKKNEMIKFGY